MVDEVQGQRTAQFVEAAEGSSSSASQLDQGVLQLCRHSRSCSSASCWVVLMEDNVEGGTAREPYRFLSYWRISTCRWQVVAEEVAKMGNAGNCEWLTTRFKRRRLAALYVACGCPAEPLSSSSLRIGRNSNSQRANRLVVRVCSARRAAREVGETFAPPRSVMRPSKGQPPRSTRHVLEAGAARFGGLQAALVASPRRN